MKYKDFFSVAATFGFGLWMASASADIVFTLGNNPQPDENNILFGASETGTPCINGEVGAFVVDFCTLTGQTLYQNAKGQAAITTPPVTPPAKSDPLTSMEVSLEGGFTFGDFILNLENGTGTAFVTVLDNVNQHFSYVLGNGQNFLTITAINGETIQSVSVTMSAGGGFDVFKQPRISQVEKCTDGVCIPQSIPEPQTLALLGLGLVGLFFVRRQRKV